MSFFTLEETKAKKSIRLTPNCGACLLYKDCKSPKMEPYGQFKRGILFFGEAPGKNEDYHGKQFMGEAGKKLKGHCSNVGILLHIDTLSINAINCHPKDKDGNNRTPTPREIDYCRPIPYQVINKYKPKVIVLFGQSAIESFLGHRWTDREEGVGAITRWRGFAIPDRETGCWVIPTYHPSFIMRNDKKKVLKKLFESDLEVALRYANIPFPEFEDEKKNVIILTDTDHIISNLKLIFSGANLAFNKNHNPMPISIDYETSGLKPHREGHYIRTCSLSSSWNNAYSFPIENNEVRKQLKRILESPEIKKIAHNLKYEDVWSRAILGAKPQGWVWDTMLTAHLLDNRRKITGLKFQTYVRYGVSGYGNLIEPYLKSKGKNANDFNNIGKAPLKDLLLYNGLDTIFTYKLFMNQVKEMRMAIEEVIKL